MPRSRSGAALAVAVAACSGASTARPVRNRGGERQAPPAELARVACGDARITWLGDTTAPLDDPMRGLRAVTVQVGSPHVEWRRYDGTTPYDWPVVVFAPDCRHAAILTSRFGPYQVVATDDLLAFARAQAVPTGYIADGQPCDPVFAYRDLQWTSVSTVRYRSGPSTGAPLTERDRELAELPTTPPAACP